MALPEDFLDELRSKNDITSVISMYANLKKRGRNYVCKCPFHNDSTPSFTVYPDTESFYCFGCAAGGDVIGFIMRAEQLVYIDAVKYLAQRAGMQMPENKYDDSFSKLRLRILEANREAARFYHSQFYTESGYRGLDYLRSRQLSDQTINKFGLGFAPDSWTALTDHLLAKKFTSYELLQANLCIESKKGSLIDRFRNRVMFPIIDLKGNVIAFGGRIMTDEKPKYLNTSDTPVFKKGDGLFAFNIAKNSKSDKFILCEGYMDVIALHQAGFDFAVAALGTALTSEQARKLKKYKETIVLCYDSDSAGQLATQRAIGILRKENVNVKVLQIPEGKDPDEYIKRNGSDGAVKFKLLLDSIESDIDYKIEQLETRFDITDASGKFQFLDQAAKMLAEIKNDIERNIYASKLCEKYKVSAQDFEMQLAKYVRSNVYKSSREEFKRVKKQITESVPVSNGVQGGGLSTRAVRAEEALISYLMHNPDMVQSVTDRVPSEKISHEFNRRVYNALTERILSGKSANFVDFSGEFTKDENAYIASVFARFSNELNVPQAVDEYISVILEENEKKSAAQLAELSPEDIQKYFDEMKARKKG
ncbi:MAG: DNA primase [Clostridia bacterium]|nr:DNA primase [Clostridia bacterium]